MKKVNKMNEEIVFNSQQEAMMAKEQNEMKLEKMKTGLIIAAAAQVLWVLIFITGVSGVLGDIMGIAAFAATIASYIFGGGILAALKATWKVAKTIGWIGWFCVPFPMDIVTGIMLTVVAVAYGIMGFFVLPLVVVFSNYRRINKELEAASAYLQ